MARLMSNSPSLQAVKAEIRGISEDQVYEALEAVREAHRAGHGTADPYENFRLRLNCRSLRPRGVQQDKPYDSNQMSSARPSDA